jgi:hypothetical protein
MHWFAVCTNPSKYAQLRGGQSRMDAERARITLQKQLKLMGAKRSTISVAHGG